MGAARFACGITNFGSDANELLASIWNPHTSISIYVVQLWTLEIEVDTAASLGIIRISTRGAAGVTVTPTIENHFDRRFAPISGVVLDAANYTVSPTTEGPELSRLIRSRTGGISLQWEGKIEVPAGTGLALIEEVGGTNNKSEVLFVWDE